MPGLAWFGEGRSCNVAVTRFIVDEVTYQANSLRTLTLRFEQRCESASAPPMRGYIRYDRDDPTVPPGPGNAADFPWTPPAGAVPATGDYFYFESSPGDYIGQAGRRCTRPTTRRSRRPSRAASSTSTSTRASAHGT